jgi:flagellar biosynthesis regulator FlaF
MKKFFICALVFSVLALGACKGGQKNDPQTIAKIEELKKELEITKAEIEDAVKKDKELAGGLVKALISVRLEILKTNEALIQQRIQALESGTPIKLEVLGTTPNEQEAGSLEKEIQAKRDELAAQKKDAARYSGGLVLAMKESAIATSENTIAMLEQRRLIAKYGLFYKLAGPKSETSPSGSGEKKQTSLLPSEELIAVKITNKRYDKIDYKEYIWFDVEWNPINLKKSARSVKGALLFCDLFGDARFKIGVTVNDPLKPGELLLKRGIGFDYNEYNDEHNWVRSTDLKDMTFRFQVSSILYGDGEREDY